MSNTDTVKDVYMARRFERALNRLPEIEANLVEDEIERIIECPWIGEKKKGDLSHIFVHKFHISGQEQLLGYHFDEGNLILVLLSLGPHENFYRDAKKGRKADLRVISDSSG